MGKTAYQKIVEAHLVKELENGDYLLRLDWVWGHEITTPLAIEHAKENNIDVVFNPNRIKTMVDHVCPSKDTLSAVQAETLRKWAWKHQIEFKEVGKGGICHALIPEQGWILPGQIGIIGDSHGCTHGAVCAFTAGVGTTDLEAGIITGLFICPPQKVIRINFVGKKPCFVTAKDMILAVLKKIGASGATNAVLEFRGPVITELTIDERFTITNMAVECGATCGMMMVDSETISYFWPILKKEFENRSDAWFHLKQRWNSDPNCQYDQIIEIDLTTIRPLIAKGYSPADVTEVSELAGQKINQVLIGSCTNGRLDDLRVAAQIFKTTCIIINPKVRCIIAPATQEIYLQALKEGLIETFITAGCCVTNPSCGACLGMSNGVLAPGEICLSTTNRNFRDRMGEGGVIFLASPQTAAASAITGSITVPPLGEKFYQRSSKPACVLPSGYNKNVNFKAVNYKALLSKISSRTKLEGDIVSEVFFFPGSTKDNIDTDQIIPAKYLNEKNKAVFGKHCFEAVPNFSLDLLEGKVIIIAGEDFGCGSSREQAVYALEAIGIKCVIAESFARIFYNNMFNNGLLCVELGKDIVSKLKEKAESGKFPDVGWKEITVLWDTPVGQPGYIFPTSSALANEKLTFKISERQKEYIRAGGAMPYMIKLAAEIFN